MTSKREEVEREIKKINKEIDKLEAQIKIITNLRQKALKQNKIKNLRKRVKELINSLPGLRQRTRRAYIIDPD